MIRKQFGQGLEREAEQFVQDFLHYCGRLTALYHLRDLEKADFETIIIGDKKTLVVFDGLRSGKDEEGAKTLMRVLQYLGVPQDQAYEMVMENQEPNCHIKYYFNEAL